MKSEVKPVVQYLGRQCTTLRLTVYSQQRSTNKLALVPKEKVQLGLYTHLIERYQHLLFTDYNLIFNFKDCPLGLRFDETKQSCQCLNSAQRIQYICDEAYFLIHRDGFLPHLTITLKDRHMESWYMITALMTTAAAMYNHYRFAWKIQTTSVPLDTPKRYVENAKQTSVKCLGLRNVNCAQTHCFQS